MSSARRKREREVRRSPLEGLRVSQHGLHAVWMGRGQRGQAGVAGVVESARAHAVHQRHANQRAQFALDAERQPCLELRHQQLHVVPAEAVAERGHHAYGGKGISQKMSLSSRLVRFRNVKDSRALAATRFVCTFLFLSLNKTFRFEMGEGQLPSLFSSRLPLKLLVYGGNRGVCTGRVMVPLRVRYCYACVTGTYRRT